MTASATPAIAPGGNCTPADAADRAGSETGSSAAPVLRHAHQVMGTVVSFDVRIGDAEPSAVLVALSRACARLDRADAVFSTWKPNSPISLIRRHGAPGHLGGELVHQGP